MEQLSQEMLQSLLQNAPNIILVVNRDSIIQYINYTVPGLSVEDAVGKNQLDFVEPEHHDLVQKAIKEVFRTGQPGQYEIKGAGPDGKTAWYLTSIGPIKRNGEVVAASLFVFDVSDRKRAEEDLKKTSDQLLASQSKAILELSTPVIQVWDDILILPLIGTIDTPRAQQILESLLEAIVNTQATVAILDITGVPVIDTSVSIHLLKAIEASKMLGAKVILTGLSPYNAQTLVKLGVDMSQVTAKSRLQQGLKLALETSGKQIVRRESVFNDRRTLPME